MSIMPEGLSGQHFLPVIGMQIPSEPSSAPKVPEEPGALHGEKVLPTLIGKVTSYHDNLVKGTEISEKELNEFFSGIGVELREDPEISEKLKELSSDQDLITAWKENKEWKGEGGLSKTPGIDEKRRHVVKVVGEIVDILAARQGIASAGWFDVGTPGAGSDIDRTAGTITDTTTPFKDNALQGNKAALAGIVWRALFDGTSLKQADVEFYPPHIGAYLTEELSDPTAKAIYSKASLTALFLQNFQQFHGTDLKQFKEEFKKEMIQSGMGESLVHLESIIKDVEELQLFTKSAGSSLPDGYKDLSNNILTMKLTEKMKDLGEQIDKMSKGTPERERLVGQFAYHAAIRARFLPEGYITKGAYDVVCKDEGGQAHQSYHRALEQGKKVDKPADLQKSTSQGLLESSGENTAYFFHKHDLIDGSKYAERSYKSGLEFVRQLRAEKPADPELNALEKDLVGKLRPMTTLEATKRHKWDVYSFESDVRKGFIEGEKAKLNELLGKKEAILKGSSSEQILHAFYETANPALYPLDKRTGKPQLPDDWASTMREVEASKNWLGRVSKNGKEIMWAALVRDARTKLSFMVLDKRQAIANVAKETFEKAQLGGKDFEYMDPKERATRDAAKIKGLISIQKSTRKLSGEGGGELRKFAGKPLTRRDAALRAATENIARIGSANAALYTVKQTQYAREEIASMKEQRGISSDTDLFEAVKSELMSMQIKLITIGLKHSVIAAPQPLGKDPAQPDLRPVNLVKAA